MAQLKFSSKQAHELFCEMRRESAALGEHSLDTCVVQLLAWNPWDATITIGRDFDKKSFTFRETYADGRSGICGGIIFHGRRDGYGSGDGPTHSVTLEHAEGYYIHT